MVHPTSPAVLLGSYNYFTDIFFDDISEKQYIQ